MKFPLHRRDRLLHGSLSKAVLRITKLLALILTTACLQVSAFSSAQTITLSERGASLEKVFNEIKKQTNYRFWYESKLLEKAKPISIDVKSASIKEVMELCLKGQPLTFDIIKEVIVIKLKVNPPSLYLPPSPQDTLQGIIINENGTPIPGATVRVKGTQIAAISDDNGNFTLINTTENATVVISSIGFEVREVPLDGKKTLKIILKRSVGKLDEAVVMAYGTTTKRLNTGDISSITADVISRQPVTNVLEALSGRAPGVFVQTQNGLPGGNVSIQIRGKGSITAGTDPLYVIDGVPYPSTLMASNSAIATSSINGATNPLNSINPNDIESISILKDADATAIYGSRGANGVVLITTKKGIMGKPRLEVNVYEGITKAANLPDLLSLKDYLQIRREAYANDGKTPSADPNSSSYAPDLMVWDTTKSTNWAKYMLGGTGHITNMQLSYSAGDAYTKYSIGGDYRSESTILPGTNLYTRGGWHINVRHSSKDNRLTLFLTNSYSADKNILTNPNGSVFTDVMLAPDYPLYNPDGSLNWTTSNPIADTKARSKIHTSNIVTNGGISYSILPNLKIRANVGYNKLSMDQVITFPSASLYPGSTGYSYFGNNASSSLIIEPQLDYTLNIKSSAIQVLLGGSWQHTTTESKFIRASNFSSEELMEDFGAAGSFSLSNNTTEYKYLSFFGRLSYDFGQKYIINASIRRDGSSRFGPGKEFGTFVAAGAGWIFSNESWAKERLKFLSFGKLRASYGITGNDQIPDYQYLATYQPSSFLYQDTAVLAPSRIANDQFHWESTKKLEWGIELGFFRDRLLLTVSHFRNRSSNQLVNYAVPYLTGFASYQANLPATVENKGWELEANSQNIMRPHFSWSSTFNITIPKNTLVDFPGLETSSYAKRLVIGEDITRVYGYRFAGLDSSGSPLFQSVSGKPTSTPQSATDSYFTWGYATPDFYGGIGNTLTWKQWQIDLFGQFVKQTMKGGITYTPGRLLNNYQMMVDRWQKPGDNTNVPKASLRNVSNYARSTANYFDASYLRLKNIGISYQFSGNWLKMHQIDLQLYLQAQNILTFWHKESALYDPESGAVASSGGNIPPLKTYVVGINIHL